MTAKLKDYSKKSVRFFLDELAAPASSPGGGSAAALVAASACALVEMVAGINDRRLKTSSGDQLKHLKNIRTKLLRLMTDDVKAFRVLQKSLKKKSLSFRQKDRIFLRAATPPFEICKLSAEIAAACQKQKKRTSLWLMSDWREALILARTAFYAAWLNVEANLTLVKDQRLTQKFHGHMKKIQSDIDAYAQN